MSEKEKPSTALVPRARPDLSDADLSALIVRSQHLFGRKAPRGLFDAALGPDLQMHDYDDVDPRGAYLIYCETSQSFIGAMRDGRYEADNVSGLPRFHVVLYPAARA